MERIVDEAIALLDEEGPDSLSMRRLAARLGTSTMSTYHHVPDRGSLIEAIADRLMSALEMPDKDAGWADTIRQLSWSFREITRRHPSPFKLLLSDQRPVALLRVGERVNERLVVLGFEEREAILAFRSFVRYLLGSAMTEADSPLPADELDATFHHGLELMIAGIAATRT